MRCRVLKIWWPVTITLAVFQCKRYVTARTTVKTDQTSFFINAANVPENRTTNFTSAKLKRNFSSELSHVENSKAEGQPVQIQG